MSSSMGGWSSPRDGFLGTESSRFVGRSAELERLHPLLAHGDGLVTILGPSGIGKTRLALRYAITHKERWDGGVWFCDLRHVADVGGMITLVLRTLGAGEEVSGREATAEVVERVLSFRRGALLVLDNLERLLPEAAAIVERWRDAAPEVRLLVTSQIALGAPREAVLELGALGLPSPGSSAGDAVDLFVHRAKGAGYTPRPDELGSIAELVRRLHGVPLAIELAASRVGAEDPEGLLTRVSNGQSTMPAPVRGPAVARRAIDRAWKLLQPWERDALCQCSVFRGGFTLEAASRVLELGAPSPPAADVLLGLAQKSLLEVQRFEPLRLAMAESVRGRAAEILSGSPHASQTEWRHAQYFHELAGAIAGLLPEVPPVPLVESARERENLEVALVLGSSARKHDIVLRIAIALDVASLGSGLSRAELGELDAALRAGGVQDEVLIERALGVRAMALLAQGKVSESRDDALRALSLATRRGDGKHMGAMHRAVANAAFQLGELTHALQHLDRALEIERERGDRSAMASVMQQLGAVYATLGDARARVHHESALALAVEIGDGPAEARTSLGLGSFHFEQGDLERAQRYYERGRALAQSLRMLRAHRIATGYLGVLHFDAGALPKAEAHLRASMVASREAGDMRLEGIFEGVRAAVLAAQDRIEESRASFALAERLLAENAFFAAVISLHRGHLDLAEARDARARGELGAALSHCACAKARVDAALAPPEGSVEGKSSQSLVQRSDDARIGLRILGRAIDAAL